MNNKLNIIINKDQNGFYASCTDLSGCHSQGNTLEEALQNLKEAAELYIETMTPDEIKRFEKYPLFFEYFLDGKTGLKAKKEKGEISLQESIMLFEKKHNVKIRR